MKSHRRLLSLLAALLVIGGGVLFLGEPASSTYVPSTGCSATSTAFRHTRSWSIFWCSWPRLSLSLAPIPSNLTAAAGALLFGMWEAFFLTVAAVLLGSMIVFWLARALGQRFASQFVSQKVSDRYLDVIRRKRDIFLILVFLFPFFPDDLICILAGLTDIGCIRFFVIVLLTRPWGLLVACGVGGSVISIPVWGMVLIGICGLTLFLLGLRYGDQIEEKLLSHFRK